MFYLRGNSSISICIITKQRVCVWGGGGGGGGSAFKYNTVIYLCVLEVTE